MKNPIPEKQIQSILLVLMLLFLIPVMSSCQSNQSNQNSGQKPQGKTQTLTTDQTSTIKTILSKYKASNLSAADAKAIHEKFREAGIHAGPETRDAIVAAGFDPEKLRTLDPPKDRGNHGNSTPPSNEQRLKTLQEKVIEPLGLSSTQKEAVSKAYSEFFTSVESLKKSQANSQTHPDKTKIEPLKKERDEKIRQILSKEQYLSLIHI